jgi:hypothetical protein
MLWTVSRVTFIPYRVVGGNRVLIRVRSRACFPLRISVVPIFRPTACKVVDASMRIGIHIMTMLVFLGTEIVLVSCMNISATVIRDGVVIRNRAIIRRIWRGRLCWITVRCCLVVGLVALVDVHRFSYCSKRSLMLGTAARVGLIRRRVAIRMRGVNRDIRVCNVRSIFA